MCCLIKNEREREERSKTCKQNKQQQVDKTFKFMHSTKTYSYNNNKKNITNITADITSASVRCSQSTTDFPKMTNTSNAKATATTRWT